MDEDFKTLWSYYTHVDMRAVTHPDERQGQRLFNVLTEFRPELAGQVRGTHMDPFYLSFRQDNPTQWDAFIRCIETQWYPE